MQSFKELFLTQGSQEWLDARKEHVTATEVAHIYTGETSIYTTVMEKRGLKEVKDLSVVPAVREGTYKEPMIRAEIEKSLPQLLDEDESFLPQPCCESIEEPFFMASLDGYSKRCGIIVEIKNIYSGSDSNWQALLEKGLEAPIPKRFGYKFQCQWQLLVTGAKMVMLCFHHSKDPFEIEPKNIRIFKIYPDPKIQEELKKIAYEVKDIMLNNKTVEPGPGDTVVVEPTQDVQKLINIYRKYEGEYNQLSERLSEINSVRSKVKDLLEQELLSDKITRVSNDSFTLTRTYREGSIDWKRMLADKVISEEVLSSYKRAGTATTRLTLK